MTVDTAAAARLAWYEASSEARLARAQSRSLAAEAVNAGWEALQMETDAANAWADQWAEKWVEKAKGAVAAAEAAESRADAAALHVMSSQSAAAEFEADRSPPPR